MTTFKAVDGFTDEFNIGVLETGKAWDFAHVLALATPTYGERKSGEGELLPCTIITGHWAAKIESGELLSGEEWEQVIREWGESCDPRFGTHVADFIARKLRGEA